PMPSRQPWQRLPWPRRKDRRRCETTSPAKASGFASGSRRHCWDLINHTSKCITVNHEDSQMIEDTQRPDKDGVPAKMQAVCDLFRQGLTAPVLRITTDDNLCSSVFICGSFDAKET